MKENQSISEEKIRSYSKEKLQSLGFSSKKALIFDYQRFTLNDGPGIRTMVYFKGCPLRCPWCHNPESLEFHIEVAEDKSEVYGFYATPEEIANYCLKDLDYYKKSKGGVTFTGGEAIKQVNHLIKISKILKENDIHIALETSGFADINDYNKILPYIDLLLIDHKAIESQYEWKIKGKYLNMFKLHKEANKLKKEVWIRMPIIPKENDSSERFDDVIKIANLFDNISKIDLLPYHSLGISKAVKVNKQQMAKAFETPSDEKVEEWLKYFRDKGIKIARRG